MFWLIGYCFIIIILAYLIDYFLARSIFKHGYRLFVAPGIIIHELSHALACKVTGAKIQKISFFDASGGSVIHAKPKIPLLGQIIISLAPLIFGIVIIYILGHFIGLNNIETSDKNNIYNILISSITNIKATKFLNWIIFYLILSIIVTMTPSLQDLKHILLSIFFIGIIVFLLSKFTSILTIHFSRVNLILLTIVSLLLLALIFSLVIYLLTRILKL